MARFVEEPADASDDDDQVPLSMRRAVPKDVTADPNDKPFFKALKQAEQLTERMVAGILLLDIVSYSWERHSFDSDQSGMLEVR